MSVRDSYTEGFREVGRHGGGTWLHTDAPVWVVKYDGVPGSNTHRYDSWQAYRAVVKVPKGRDPWTVDNRRIGPEDGWATPEPAFATAREAAASATVERLIGAAKAALVFIDELAGAGNKYAPRCARQLRAALGEAIKASSSETSTPEPLHEKTVEFTESIHQCRMCSTYWRKWGRGGGWSLADANQKPKRCCDNTAAFMAMLVPPIDPEAK